MAKLQKTLGVITLTLLISMLSPITLAAGGDLYLSEADIYFSTNNLVENVQVMIYATAGNNAGEDLLGTIKFWNDTLGTQISSDQPISVLAGSTDTVFVTWTPPAGAQQVSVTVHPWDTSGDDSGNNTVWKTITVDADTDGDGVGNTDDSDDDNDGYPDYEDDFPLNGSEWEDTDGDGTGNNEDTDDDNDGTSDENDEMSLDYEETQDTDGDGIGNNKDSDDDGDGILDESEQETNPLNEDSDSDGYSDSEDAFPMDSEEWTDYDNDGIGDNADPDDDNDGILDTEDNYPQNTGPVIKLDTGLIHFAEQEITIDASDSYDEDGQLKSFKWAEGEEILSTEKSLTTTYLESGEKTLELTVTDNTGESITEEVTIRIYSREFIIFMGLFIIILLCLAFYIIYKYNPRAKQVKKSLEKKAKNPKKSKK